VAASTSATVPAHGDGLTRGTPRSVGVDAAAISAFLDDVESTGLELHNLMIWRDGAVITEAWRWPYSADRLRMTHSMTKSITACAIGLLIDEGRLALTDTVAGFFPEVDIEPLSRQARMTVEDLLTMRSGHAEEVSGSIWRGIETSWVTEFFRIPVEHEPGTKHVYSSAASYMLSAIVTRITGETISSYLTPRLFEPLGIAHMRWDVGPDGVNPGGNGVSLRSADALKLGILHAQGGVWQGRQILPRQWVEQATRAHGVPDYGYHWVIGDGYFAALGVFVQMVIVFPDSNLVIALNSAMEESRVLLPHLLKHFPAAFTGGGDAASDAVLARRLARWSDTPPLPALTDDDAAPLAGIWAVRDNPLGIADLQLTFDGDRVHLELTDAEGAHGVVAGHMCWRETTTDLRGASLHHGYRLRDAPTVAGGRWIAPNEYELVLHFAESAFRDCFRFRLAGDELTMERSVNINSGRRAWPQLIADRVG
jgi:CubicO group peptidase (beta-lactamase class C family)